MGKLSQRGHVSSQGKNRIYAVKNTPEQVNRQVTEVDKWLDFQ